MTIRIFIPWFLPAYKAGGPIQTIANLVAQQERGRAYKIVCSAKDLDGTVLVVKKDRWLRWNEWTEIIYTSSGTNDLLGAGEEILFINGIYSWQYNLKPILFSKAGRKILSPRGMLHAGALSQKAVKKGLFLLLWKWAGLHRKLEFHATDETEKEAIQKHFGKRVTVHLASNLPRFFQRQPVGEKKGGELRLVSIALLGPMKNILLVLQALKKVKETIVYQVYGPVKDGAYWARCREVIESLPSNITVHYGGDLHPAKVEEALGEGQVFILPSRSENFGHALIEALSAGKPVITSAFTPWNDLQTAKAGCNLATTNKKEIAGAIRFFAAMEAGELETWSRGARAYAESAIDVEKIKQQYRDMFGTP